MMNRHSSAVAVASIVLTIGLAGCSTSTSPTSSSTGDGPGTAAVGSQTVPASSLSVSSPELTPSVDSTPSPLPSSTAPTTTSSPPPARTGAPSPSSAVSASAPSHSFTPAPAITAGSKAPTPAQAKVAQQKFIDLARSALPGVPTATAVQTAKTLCITLAKGASLHDEVGELAGQLQGQATAENLARAAVDAYCPTVTLH